MFSREAAIINFIFLGMIRPEIEPTIYHTQASTLIFLGMIQPEIEPTIYHTQASTLILTHDTVNTSDMKCLKKY